MSATVVRTREQIDADLAECAEALSHCQADEYREVIWRDVDRLLDERGGEGEQA
jgi:hypothetical protein